MKRNFLMASFLTVCLCLFSFQCDSDDDGNAPIDNSADIAAIISAAQDGTWRISSYIDSGQNETSDYSGYSFLFASNGTLTATSQTATRTGTWSVTDDSSSDDDSNDGDIDFNIFFAVTSEDDIFDDLNDDWDVVSYSNTQIQLRDVSGGDGSVDTLTFVKN